MAGQVRPRDVPGYAEAVAAGRVRPVPPAPPPLLPGRPASQALVVFGVETVVTIGVWFAVFAGVRAVTGSPGAAQALLMVAASLAAFAVIIWLLHRVGDRNLQEFAQGYTTVTLTFGGFYSSLGTLRSPRQLRVPWDYRGVWVLDGRTGRVISAPDPRLDPPGFYPSPHRTGAMELWTGAAWSGDFR